MRGAVNRNRQRCAVVTYLDLNLSDDLIRLGTEYLLRAAFGPDMKFVRVSRANPFSYINKHLECLHRVKGLRRVGYADSIHRRLGRFSPLQNASCVAIAGTPWFYSDRAGRYSIGRQRAAQLLINHYGERLSEAGIPLLCVGLGNSFSLGEDAAALLEDGASCELLKRLLSLASAITVRDSPAKKCVEALGYTCHQNVCPSVFAARAVPDVDRTERRRKIGVVLSAYIRALHPREAVDTFHERLAKVLQPHMEADRLLLIAHTQSDRAVLREWFPALPVWLPDSPESYVQLMRTHCSQVLTSRVHAAMVAHSLGIPAHCFKIDERAVIAEQAGVPVTLFNEPIDADLAKRWANRLEGEEEEVVPDYDAACTAYVTLLERAYAAPTQ